MWTPLEAQNSAQNNLSFSSFWVNAQKWWEIWFCEEIINLITWQWLSGNHVIVKITCTQQGRVRNGNFPSLRRCYTTQFFRATSVATAKFALLQLHGKRCYPLQCFLQLVPQETRLRLMQCIQGRRETTFIGGCVHWIARIRYFYKIARILLDALTTNVATCDRIFP